MRVLLRQRQLERSCRWTRAALQQHQARQLSRLREFACRESRFYRSFHRGLQSRPLEDLPILSKAELMEHFDELVTAPDLRLSELDKFLESGGPPALFQGRYVVLSTSGSTGLRGVFVFNDTEWITALASITRPIAWLGLNPNPMRPRRAAFIASTSPWHYSARVSHSLANRFLPSLRIDASVPLPRIVRQLNEWQPELLAAYPSVLRQLAEEQIAGRLHIPLRNVTTSAEVLTAETRRRVAEAWNAPVYDTYGATEYAPIASECPLGRRHLFEDGAIIEIVDHRGRPVPDGADGDRVLLTIFNRHTQPLIRYEISDMVRPVPGACECGRPFRLIEAIQGRQEDVLRFPSPHGGAVDVHPNVFHQLLETIPAGGWQIVQDGERLHVYLAGLREAASVADIGERVRARLEADGAMVGHVVVTPVEALDRGPSGKAPLIRGGRRASEAAAG
ncbi:MAG TPA: AMP-binding protein [Bryobacteraceae bacterium]|nr:AMP-binding protein [Bryobacteraceae bacterium]